MSILKYVTVFGVLLLLTSCLVPENFETTVTVKKDGSYVFIYDGTLAFAPALAELAQKGSLSQEFEEELRGGLVKELQQDSDFKKVKYVGKGRCKVFVEKHGKPGEQYSFLSSEKEYFSVEPQRDGTIKISATRYSREDLDKLKSIGAKIDGKLKVSVKKGVEVLQHNAQSKPKLFGFLGSYAWEIKSVDADPTIVVRP